MKCLQDDLRVELLQLTEKHLQTTRKWKSLNAHELNQKSSPEAWSALECLEHLCRYGDFYLPECKERIKSASSAPSNEGRSFKSSCLGEYFAKSMWPQEKLNTMKTFKSMNPTFSDTRAEVLLEFEKQLEDWLEFLKASGDYDWTAIRTSISISSLIKLRLGDTLRVVLYHNERHIRQAQRAMGKK